MIDLGAVNKMIGNSNWGKACGGSCCWFHNCLQIEVFFVLITAVYEDV